MSDPDAWIQSVNAASQRATTAAANNAAYLASGAPTAAELAAQVKALTRQLDALISFCVALRDSA